VEIRADAFGHALMDWVQGGTVPEVYEREDGFVDVGAGPDLFLADHRNWPTSERQAVRYVSGRVIDVGCGAGRVALHLQQRGLEVVGLDVSPLATRACRIRGVNDVWRASIEDLSPSIASFDTIILFGNNLGIFGSPERVRRALAKWADRMKPGARILAQSTSPYEGGAPAIDPSYARGNRQRGLMPGRVRLRIRYRHWATGWFSWLFLSPSELRGLLRGTGWHQERMFAGAPSEPYVAVLERDSGT
jgi:SAM-dependent methyltransferase